MTLIRGISHCVLLIYLTLAITTTGVLAFQKAECNQLVTNLLNNGSISPTDDIFYRENGVPMSDVNHIVLTVPGCVDTCGAKSSFYVDIGPRLSTWLIPILILIGNAHFARLGKEKYLMIFHVLGDPIDCMWSLLTKAELWSRCYSMAKTYVHKNNDETDEHYERRVLDVGTVYAAIEDLVGSGTDDFRLHFDQIMREKRPDMTTEHFYHLTKEVANELSDSRSNELRRAGLAVLGYLYHVIAAFVEAVGGKSSSQPGGRIGTALLLSFLIPLVLVSNAMGGFTSRRTCLRIMERYVKIVTGNSVEDLGRFSADKKSVHFLKGRETISNTDFYSAQQWSGTMTCYTARKRLGFTGGPRDNSPGLLLFAAFMPVFIAAVISITEICLTPTTGLGCRSLMLIIIFLMWMVSAFITWVTWSAGIVSGRYHYIMTITKDALIGIPIVLMIFLSSSGLFNSCYCWSAIYSRGRDAHVLLNDIPARKYNAETYYPGLVSSCLGGQFILVWWMLRLIRHGSTLFRRDENQKQEDWVATHTHRKRLGYTPTLSPLALMPFTPGDSPESLYGKQKPIGSPELPVLDLDSRVSSAEPLLRIISSRH